MQLLLEFAWRDMSVNPDAITFQAIPVTAVDGPEIRTPFELQRVPLRQQSSQAKSANPVAAAQGNDVHELVRQNRTHAVRRGLVFENSRVDIYEISHLPE